MLSIFDLAAVLLTLSALFGWLNHKFLLLPHSIELLLIEAGGGLLLGVLTGYIAYWGIKLRKRGIFPSKGPPISRTSTIHNSSAVTRLTGTLPTEVTLSVRLSQAYLMLSPKPICSLWGLWVTQLRPTLS